MRVKSQRLAHLTKVLIFDETLFQAVRLFFDTFLASYFYQISPESLFDLTLYSFVSYSTNIIILLVFRNFIKRVNKVWMYRLGVVIQLAFTLLIMVMGENIVDYVVLLGVLYGIRGMTNGFINTMFIPALIPKKDRVGFYGYSAALIGVINLAFPLIFGAYITISSYQTAAILVLILSGIRLVNSFFIKDIPHDQHKADFRGFSKILKKDRHMQRLFLIEFFKGINLYGVMVLLANLLIIMQSGNDLVLGGWVSVFYACNIIAMLIFAKKYQRQNKTGVMLFLLLLTSLGSFAILYEINLVTVVCYNISFYVGAKMVEYITNTDLHDYGARKRFNPRYLTEFYSFRELALCFGRIFGYGALMILAASAGTNLTAVSIIFAIVAASLVVTILLSLTLRRK